VGVPSVVARPHASVVNDRGVPPAVGEGRGTPNSLRPACTIPQLSITEAAEPWTPILGRGLCAGDLADLAAPTVTGVGRCGTADLFRESVDGAAFVMCAEMTFMFHWFQALTQAEPASWSAVRQARTLHAPVAADGK
jgi:hypothetical protein